LFLDKFLAGVLLAKSELKNEQLTLCKA
jgi:hypothetical protein